MAFVNLYKPKENDDNLDLYGPEPYDINFPFPIHSETLENDLIKLTPFVPRVHAKLFWDKISSTSETTLKYIPWKLDTFEDYLALIELDMRRSPEWVLFAIIDKTRPEDFPGLGGQLAGHLGLLRTTPSQLSTEIGAVVILPAYQRTHVTSNAVGLLLRYCLETPSASPPGLGLRRVMWAAHHDNAASVKCAEKMGYKLEGTMRWARVLPNNIGLPTRPDDPIPEKAGRHSVLLSICWDDWENGVREHVAKRMAPRK